MLCVKMLYEGPFGRFMHNCINVLQDYAPRLCLFNASQVCQSKQRNDSTKAFCLEFESGADMPRNQPQSKLLLIKNTFYLHKLQ